MSEKTEVINDDDAQLKALGYTSNFDRTMSVWENFSLGFTYLSPVVGVYTVFALALTSGGPPAFWSYLLVGLGQLLVCLIFGEVVSQFPISGGLYPWARRLVGKKWAWMAGWIYMWALCTTIAAVAVGGAPYIAQMLGIDMSQSSQIIVALVMVTVTTLLNVSGTKLLARVAMIGFICELVGAGIVGGYLLIFARHQTLDVLFNTFSFGSGVDYLPSFLAASVAAMFAYYGFEACGDVAEETPNPSKAIPKAMRMTIYVGGGAAMFILFALIMAVPNMADAVSGKDKDPVSTLLISAMGLTGFKLVIAVVLVSFISCLLSLQAAASRLLFAYARDNMIVGSAKLSKLSPHTHVPVAALFLAGFVPAGIVVMGLYLENAARTIIVFGSVGIYLAFQMIVLGALYARAKGWKPSGSFQLGRWALPVNLGALAYGICAILNLVWPRTPNDAWYYNYGMILTSVIVIGTGLLYMLIAKPYDNGTSPYGDAHLLHKK